MPMGSSGIIESMNSEFAGHWQDTIDTMRQQPTLSELRGRVYKGSGGRSTGAPVRPPVEIGNVFARKIARPAAVYGTWLAVRLGLSANQVTILALIANLAAALAIATGTRAGFVAGALLAQLAYWLDHVDGQVARWNGTACLTGVYFDYLMHHVATLAIGFALGFALAVRTGSVGWTAGGFLVATGWHFLGLQNDCRYKAFFQRLKVETATYRVVGGSGGRPGPPAAWPRRGYRVLTWPAYKMCEPHAVLMTLAVLTMVAITSDRGFLWCLKSYVLSMALGSPLLAAARIGRAIRRGVPDEEFGRWFREKEPGPSCREGPEGMPEPDRPGPGLSVARSPG